MKSLSRQASRKRLKTGWVLLLVGLMFVLIGGGIGWFAFARPVLKIQQARSWSAVPCEIVSSRVKSHRSSDGTTYSVEITYRYEFAGRTYTSDRYKFMGGSSSGRSGKAKVVARYPPGSQATCYVDPADPSEAVIERGYTADLLFGLIPMVFVLAGAGMLIGGVMSIRRAPPSAPLAAGMGAMFRDDEPAGPVTLDAGRRRLGKLAGITVLAIAWNALSWGGMVLVWRDGAWMGITFLSLFVLIGLGLLGGVAYMALAMFNPTVRLTLSRRAVALGETLEVNWELIGQTGRLKSLHLTLEGTEEATYQRGTDTVTDRHVFRVIDLAHVEDRRALVTATGSIDITMPTDTMHSFEAGSNKIVWQLRAHGEIPRWPDVNDTWSLTVRPQPVATVQPVEALT